MSSCYSSSAPCIIHASLSIHPFALQPRSYQPSPQIPHHTHTTINYIFGMMTSYSLRSQVVVSAGEDGPCVCDCEDGLIHTPVSCAISYQYLPPPLALDMISSSCLLVTLPQPHVSSYIHHYPSIHLPYNPEATNPVHRYHTTHTQQSTISLG
jgi:hypothetical protein